MVATTLTLIMSAGLTAACKTAQNRGGAEFFAARDQAENPNASNIAWRADWIEKNSYRRVAELPSAEPNSACETLQIMIELPAIGGTLEVGHTGVAIGEEYYDYGPVEEIEKSTVRLRAKGGPYWDHPEKWPGARSTDEISFKMITETISSLATDHTVVVIPMIVEARHASRIREWWKNTYETAPEYGIPGLHCTSSVIRSIEGTDPKRNAMKNPVDMQLISGASAVTSPLKYAQILLGNAAMNTGRYNLTHSCGPLKGQPLKAAVINVGPDLGTHGNRLKLKTE